MAMRRQVVFALALVTLLALAAPALAKGPARATLSGPGLESSIAVTGEGEGGTGTALGALVDSGGFFAQVFGQTPDRTSQRVPAGTRGPRYTVVYVVPGPNEVSSGLVEYVYPYAKPVPLTYMRATQRFWDGRRTHGGWYRSTPALTRLLIRLGLPAQA
jgi:hypothetical protein